MPAKSRRLRSKMRKLGPMIKGSAIFREMRCGKAICKCTRGEPHLYLCVVYKEKGKSKTVYVDRKRQAEALIYSGNYRKFKAPLEEHSQLNLTLLKSEKKVKKGR